MERPSWEDWKQKQRADELREQAALDEQARQMEEYKKGLERDRARRLGGDVDKSDKKRKRSSNDKKKNKKKKSSKDKKVRGKRLS